MQPLTNINEFEIFSWTSLESYFYCFAICHNLISIDEIHFVKTLMKTLRWIFDQTKIACENLWNYTTSVMFSCWFRAS
jgi:hypothetical protein